MLEKVGNVLLSPMITVKIDVTKLDKSAFFHSPKGPIYADLILVPKPSPYGDGFIAQSLPKDRREAGERGPIVGDWKELQPRPKTSQAPAPAPTNTPSTKEDGDSIPF